MSEDQENRIAPTELEGKEKSGPAAERLKSVSKPAVASGAVAKPAPPKKAPPPPDPRVEAAKAKAQEVRTFIEQRLSAEAVVETGTAHIHPMLLIRKEDWVAVVDLLKRSDAYQLNYLECMAGTDYPNYIEVVIYLQSTELGHFICLKTRTDRERAEIPSLCAVHPGVNWEEREIYDLLGVTFTGHPDLRRIMLDEDFNGHPLRKDYSAWEA